MDVCPVMAKLFWPTSKVGWHTIAPTKFEKGSLFTVRQLHADMLSRKNEMKLQHFGEIKVNSSLSVPLCLTLSPCWGLDHRLGTVSPGKSKYSLQPCLYAGGCSSNKEITAYDCFFGICQHSPCCARILSLPRQLWFSRTGRRTDTRSCTALTNLWPIFWCWGGCLRRAIPCKYVRVTESWAYFGSAAQDLAKTGIRWLESERVGGDV